jgi:hypothetical protein
VTANKHTPLPAPLVQLRSYSTHAHNQQRPSCWQQQVHCGYIQAVVHLNGR